MAELFRDIHLLQDLDAGDLKSARRRLDDDSMIRIFKILENLHFTTNARVLSADPGLRAAAKYWRGTGLPPDTMLFPMTNSVASNTVYRALSIVRDHLGLGKLPTHSREKTSE